MISYDTGTKVRVIVANPYGVGTRECPGIVMAGPRMSFDRDDSHMVLLTTAGVPNFTIYTNPEILILPVLPDGPETGTEVSVKVGPGQWHMGHIAAGPLTEKAAAKLTALRPSSLADDGMNLVLTEHGHLQSLYTSRLYPY